VSALARVRDDDHVVNVRTGELLELKHAASDELAAARAALVDHKREVDAAIAQLDEELVGRVDRAVRDGEMSGYSVRLPGWEIRVPSPTAGGKLDAGALRAATLARADELGLAPAAIEQAFASTTSYTLRRAKWNTLVSQAPELTDLLRVHTGPPDRRRATVTPLEFAPAAIEATVEEDYPA
jgi:hypothetical protein